MTAFPAVLCAVMVVFVMASAYETNSRDPNDCSPPCKPCICNACCCEMTNEQYPRDVNGNALGVTLFPSTRFAGGFKADDAVDERYKNRCGDHCPETDRVGKRENFYHVSNPTCPLGCSPCGCVSCCCGETETEIETKNNQGNDNYDCPEGNHPCIMFPFCCPDKSEAEDKTKN